MISATPLSYYTRQKTEYVCLICSLWQCNELATACAYRMMKPDPMADIKRAFIERSKLKTAIANLGFKKYDKRRKPDTPQRMLWRQYKERNKASV